MFDCAEPAPRCRAVEEQLYHPDIGHYSAYGLELRTEKEALWVSDVSPRRDVVEQLAAQLAEADPSPQEFLSQVEDFCEQLNLY